MREVFCPYSAVIDRNGKLVFLRKNFICVFPLYAEPCQHTGNDLRGEHCGAGLIKVFDIESVYRILIRRFAAELAEYQLFVIGRSRVRRGRRSVTEPEIEEGSLRLIHLQDLLDLLYVLAGKPERLFNKAIKLLPGDPDLRTEFIDG